MLCFRVAYILCPETNYELIRMRSARRRISNCAYLIGLESTNYCRVGYTAIFVSPSVSKVICNTGTIDLLLIYIVKRAKRIHLEISRTRR